MTLEQKKINLPALTQSQFDALLAGLRLLAASIQGGLVRANDGEIGEIWTNMGEHEGLPLDDIQDLGDELNGYSQ